MKYVTTINNVTFEIEIERDGTLLVNGEKREIDFLPLDDSALYSIIADTKSHELLIESRDGLYDVLLHGNQFSVKVQDERAQLLASRRGLQDVDTGEISIRAPMPGLVVEISVSEGDTVTSGQTIIILESMKMQNELKVPRDAIVQRISVEAGQSVEQGKLLITLT